MRPLLILALGALPLPAQQPPHEDSQAEMSAASLYIGDQSAIEAGRELYLTSCSGCHGATAEGGRGPNLITGRNARRAGDEELFDMIKNGVPGSDMPPSSLPDEKVWQIAAYVRNLSAPAYEQNLPGDVEAGKALFYGAGGCTSCHMIRGSGGYLGPDLTNIGMTVNAKQLREGLLEPNRRITEGYRPVEVMFPDGRKITGVAKNNSNYSIQMLDGDGRLHLLDKADLAEVRFREKSWMPDDYGERFSEAQIENLLAFLSRQVFQAPPAIEGSGE